jgi:hypothetical protein
MTRNRFSTARSESVTRNRRGRVTDSLRAGVGVIKILCIFQHSFDSHPNVMYATDIVWQRQPIPICLSTLQLEENGCDDSATLEETARRKRPQFHLRGNAYVCVARIRL